MSSLITHLTHQTLYKVPLSCFQKLHSASKGEKIGPEDVQYRVTYALGAKKEVILPRNQYSKNCSEGGHTVLGVLSSDVFVKNSFMGL